MKNYFEGRYYKHQAQGKTLAVIPGRANSEAFIQVITNDVSYKVKYPPQAYIGGETMRVGKSVFSPTSIELDICEGGVELAGELIYSNLTPLKSDIMGPFKYLPMECRHAVFSMRHEVSGKVRLFGEELDFSGGRGYIEGDSGSSFPKKYSWVHCNDFSEDCSIMASLAQIPFLGGWFWGCICVVLYNGTEYRLATYRGAKIARREPGIIEIAQGRSRLRVSVDKSEGKALDAPLRGDMTRTIYESAACCADFEFFVGADCVFRGGSENASFECQLDEC